MAETGRARDVEFALARADTLLGSFYETLFRALRRMQNRRDAAGGGGGSSEIEIPSELTPYMNWKAPKVARQPQARSALKELLLSNAELAESVCNAYSDWPEDPLDAAFVAARSGNTREIAKLACVGAAQAALACIGTTADAAEDAAAAGDRGADPVDVLVILAAASDGIEGARAERARSDAREAGEKSERGNRRVVHAEKKQRKAEKQSDADHKARERAEARLRDVQHELGEERAASKSAADSMGAELKSLRKELERTQDDSARLQARLDDAKESHARTVSNLKAALDDARAEEAAARAELDATRLAHLESLDAPAGKLKALAADILEIGARLIGDDADEGEAQTESDDAASRVLESAQASVVVRPPLGVLPDSADMLKWAFDQRHLLVVIDGYNVTMHETFGWKHKALVEQRSLLLDHLQRSRPRKGADVHIVFDSREKDQFFGRRMPPGITIEYSQGRIADDRIVDFVLKMDPKRPTVAVTSDHELRERLGTHGVHSVQSGTLLEVIGAIQK